MVKKKIKFKIATPERVVFESEADSVTCPTQMGEVTILPNHIPLVANLNAGELKVIENGSPRHFAVSGGFIEVRPKNEVIVLADAAEREEEIDIKRAEEARQRARKLMAEEVKDAEKFVEAQALLERSLARIKVARKRKYKDVGKQM
ncbi:MAG: F0F1 ATP synthase subunit epsilon [Candidatus Doudnabacteria bacterium]|nr:F0F1 ATP synthase subunit epsilon [Candidatus Doudnabacteria bacterium]